MLYVVCEKLKYHKDLKKGKKGNLLSHHMSKLWHFRAICYRWAEDSNSPKHFILFMHCNTALYRCNQMCDSAMYVEPYRGIYGGPESSTHCNLRKTHASRQNTGKVRKHLHQFDNTAQHITHNTTHYRNVLQIQTPKSDGHVRLLLLPQFGVVIAVGVRQWYWKIA